MTDSQAQSNFLSQISHIVSVIQGYRFHSEENGSKEKIKSAIAYQAKENDKFIVTYPK